MRRWGLGAAVWLWAASAGAHLMPAGHGTVNVVGQKAYVVLALPVKAFKASGAAEAVADGVLTPAELTAHQGALQAAVRAGLAVEVDGQPATVGRVLLNQAKAGGPAHAHAHSHSELTAMVVVQLPKAPGALQVRSRLWAGAADTLKLEVTLTQGERVARAEVHTLTPKAPAHHFFVAPAPPTPPHPHHHGPGGHTH